jgi:hypothetical protein
MVAYVASLLWGVLFSLGVTCAWTFVPRIHRRLGRAAGTVAVLLCVALFLAALEVPRSTGILDEAGWMGVALFAAGVLCVEIPWARRRALEAASKRQARFERAEVAAGSVFFDSPEAAALSGWRRIARAHVIRTKCVDERKAEVLVDTEPSCPVLVECERLGPGWIWTRDIDA